MDNILELKKITKYYGKKIKTQVLFGMDLEIKKGSFNSIIGQSGSGKSTLLNIIGTLDNASEGDVIINGKNIKNFNKKQLASLRNETMGFIFQFHYLLPEFTVLENILIPYRIQNKKVNKEILGKAEELIELVGLTNVKNNLATNLSGGQQQRTAIARALINQPKLILADEPTGNLDSDTTDQIYDLMRDINKKYATTFIVITHDQSVAEKTDRIIEIKDGKIIMDVSKEAQVK
jgi:lipoprotein-releasing system ATP-binding protein